MPGIIIAIIVLLMWGSCFVTILAKKANRKQSDPAEQSSAQDKFLCRVEQSDNLTCDGVIPSFGVMIKGRINAPEDNHQTNVTVKITDLTDERAGVQAVLSPDKKQFSYRSSNMCIPSREFTLSDWISVVDLPIENLIFAERGLRRMKFEVSVVSSTSGEALARGFAILNYENPRPGYNEANDVIDILILRLAMAVNYAHAKAVTPGNDIINEWLKERVDSAENENAAAYMSEHFKCELKKAKSFFRSAISKDVGDLCYDINEISLPEARLEIMELCVKVAGASSRLLTKRSAMLIEIARALQINRESLSAVAQKNLPINSCQIDDMNFILGITDQMSIDETLHRLNDEYRKWNARVTNPDKSVAQQATQMLNLIAGVRNTLAQPC